MIAAGGGHHDRTEANHAALIGGLGGRISPWRSRSSAKSTIMMAFFLTIPISMIRADETVDIEMPSER